MPEPTPLGLAYAPERKREVDEEALVEELAASGWLRAYVQWAGDQTDAPRLFHIGAGLSALGASLGNRVRYYAWGRDIFPHLWLCILAPSGHYRKTTSATMAARLLRDCSCATDKVGMLIPKDFSREKLIAYLADRPDGLLVQDEFAEFLAKLTRDYNVGARELLTGLFDGEVYDRITGAGGHITITDPAISVLTSSTLDWIGERVTAGDLRGGFLSRFLFLPAKAKNGWRGIEEGVSPSHWLRREELVKGLRARTALVARADFSGVVAEFNGWLRGYEDSNNAAHDPRLIGFLSRAAAYVIKLALCFEVSEWPCNLVGDVPNRRLVVRSGALHKALTFWTYLAANVGEIVTEQIATTWSERGIKRVLEVFDAAPGPVSRSTLLRSTRMLEKELDQYLKTLTASEQIEQIVDRDRTGSGRRAMLYQRRRGRRGSDDGPPPINLTEPLGKNGKEGDATPPLDNAIESPADDS